MNILFNKCKLFSPVFFIILPFLSLIFENVSLAQEKFNNLDFVPASGVDSINVYKSDLPLISAEESEFSSFTNTQSRVVELSDVSSNDSYFQSLKLLTLRYSCSKERFFLSQKNASITRNEFALALSNCIKQIEGKVLTQDLEQISYLKNEFKDELESLENRISNVAVSLDELNNNQFSTTSKLSAQVFMNLTGAVANNIIAEGLDSILDAGRDVQGNPIRRVTGNPNTSFSSLLWLNLNTSFTGKDDLAIQIAAGNGFSPANTFSSSGWFNTSGVPFTDVTAGPPLTGKNQFVLRELSYSFPVGKNINITVGPRINWYKYFDNTRFTSPLNGLSSFNFVAGSTLLNTVDRGAGIVFTWNPNKIVQLKAAYLGESSEYLRDTVPFNSAARSDRGGLFGGTNTINFELVLSPVKNFNIRIDYARSKLSGIPSSSSEIGGLVGGPNGEPILGLLDDGSGGNLRGASANTFNLNFDWLINSGFGLFGRYTFGTTNLAPINPSIARGTVQVQAFQFGLVFPDLGKKGSLWTVGFVVPNNILEGRKYYVSGGGDGGTQWSIESTYYLPINDNVAVVPSLYLIDNINNFDQNPLLVVGNIRLQFKF
jgi:hypothetical protein